MARLMFQASILELDGQDKSAWFELSLLELFPLWLLYLLLLFLTVTIAGTLIILTNIAIISACSWAFCSFRRPHPEIHPKKRYKYQV